MRYNGKGIAQNYTEAFKWYQKAAEQGDADAQCNLGRCYEYGNGIDQNYTEAVKWYKKAAEQGYARAQCNLGYCYYHEKGITKNYTEAVKWYQKAAKQGYARAQNNLGLCYELGNSRESATPRISSTSRSTLSTTAPTTAAPRPCICPPTPPLTAFPLPSPGSA